MARLDLAEIATNLTRDPTGFWVAGSSDDVSYPARGHDWSFAVEDQSFWFQHRNRAITAAVRRFPPSSGGPIFDVGAGNGYVTEGLQRGGYVSIAIEPGKEGATHAVERGVHNVVCASLEAAGFRDDSAGAIGLFDVLEHIENDMTFFRSLHRVLKRGGRVYVTVPAYHWLWSERDHVAGHYRRYTLSTLRDVCARASFVVEYATYLFWCLPLPILLARTVPSLFGVTQSVSVERARSEHGTGRSNLRSLVELALDLELRWIARCRRVPFGASCLLVARVPGG